MKARIIKNNSQFVLTFEPESEDEKLALRELCMATGRAHIMNCRGFQYMNPSVEFLVQPMPRSD